MTNPTITLVANFTAEGVLVTTPDGSQSKLISASDFLKTCMSHLPSAVDITTRTTLYPHGTVFVERNINSLHIAVYYAAHRHKCKLALDGGTKEYDIPLPNVVLEARLKINDSGSLSLGQQEYSLYATTLSPGAVAHRLKKGFSRINNSSSGMGELAKGFYYLPVTNIYGSGYLCLGSNSTPATLSQDNLIDLHRYYEIAVDSPGNNDLTIPGIKPTGVLGTAYGDRRVAKLYEEWSKLSEFPYNAVQEFA